MNKPAPAQAMYGFPWSHTPTLIYWWEIWVRVVYQWKRVLDCSHGSHGGQPVCEHVQPLSGPRGWSGAHRGSGWIVDKEHAQKSIHSSLDWLQSDRGDCGRREKRIRHWRAVWCNSCWRCCQRGGHACLPCVLVSGKLLTPANSTNCCLFWFDLWFVTGSPSRIFTAK